jgi:hypothetical protein
MKHQALVALFVLSSAFSSQAGFCYSIEQAQAQVKEAEVNQKEDPQYYAHTLLTLAIEYYKAGEIEKSEETFRKSIEPAKAGESLVATNYPDHLMMYASLLSEGREGMVLPKEDFKRVDAALIEALKVMEARPDPGNRKGNYASAVEIFDKTGNTEQRDKYKKLLLNFCQKVEGDSKASKEDVSLAVVTLNKLAEIEFPCGPIRSLPTHVVNLDPDPNATSKLTVTRFKRAEGLKLRAVKLGDRLPKDNVQRIDLHREMVYWYMLFGQTKKADDQKEVLSGLLGAKNSDVMFPPRKPCLGCGRG